LQDRGVIARFLRSDNPVAPLAREPTSQADTRLAAHVTRRKSPVRASEPQFFPDDMSLELLTVTDTCVAGVFELTGTGDLETGHFIGPRC